jgi:uncharacterized membrane protein YqgA involved in biofilm formation
MWNIAVIANTVAVIIGSLIGLLTGKGISGRFRSVFFQAIGLLTIGLGVKMFFDASHALLVLISLAAGGLIGEALKIEDWLGRLADRFNPNEGATVARGFVVALVLFVPGPMTVLGSLQAGLAGNNELLLIKSLMDGISSVLLATAYGRGVLLSAAGVYLIQGLLVTFASALSFLQSPQYLGDFSGVGGLMLLGIGIRMLELRDIKVGNYLPALLISPILSAIFG